MGKILNLLGTKLHKPKIKAYSREVRLTSLAELEITAIIEEWQETHSGTDPIQAANNSVTAKKISEVMTRLESDLNKKLVCTFWGVKQKRGNTQLGNITYVPMVKIQEKIEFDKKVIQ